MKPRKFVPRGKNRPAGERLEKAFDRHILSSLKRGGEVVYKAGVPATNPDGSPILKPFSPAWLNAVRGRLRDIARLPKKTSGQEELLRMAAERMKYRGASSPDSTPRPPQTLQTGTD